MTGLHRIERIKKKVEQVESVQGETHIEPGPANAFPSLVSYMGPGNCKNDRKRCAICASKRHSEYCGKCGKQRWK